MDYRRWSQLDRLISQKNFEYLLIDIRSEREYERAHIPTAVSIPYEKLITSLPVENMFLTIIVYGGKGNKPVAAARYLSRSGYFNVTSFGAISRWKGELTRIGYKGEKHIEYSEKGRADFPV
ncbi:rhodanese-like domain-containing protein [Spirochaeta isovalerica]|uniref:Rhodanese-related sulfurtransferase n=1 Tax=Spirochaeta isovalerica TaxID=150 RepID=A0A841RGP7_9SPIO|nr:rhodanese-like domain-containing protein [Spirochaeta isovalerica]MBB6482561.1 rhodanese-related sulfurtransferase [Spirochaeta isovalerica]